MEAAQLAQIARNHGCAGLGVTSADAFPEVAASMEERRASGLSADLPFTYTDPHTATTPTASFPWARSIVAVAYPYLPGTAAADPKPGTMAVARFAESDHYAPLRAALAAIAAALERAGHRALALVDDSRLVDRAVAVRAGVGWWGKSTMVLVPGYGPWVLLGSIVTDAGLAFDRPMRRTCGSCVACMPACPTGAISPEGVLDAGRCLAYWLQTSGVIPLQLRQAVGDRLYGCDECLTACPPGRRVLEQSVDLPLRPRILDILGADDATLLERYAHFYLPGRRPRILRRNALVVAGNVAVVAGNDGSAALRDPVLGYLGHPDWLLRAHAVWAAARFSGAVVDAALDAAAAGEHHPRVRAELDAASGLR